MALKKLKKPSQKSSTGIYVEKDGDEETEQKNKKMATIIGCIVAYLAYFVVSSGAKLMDNIASFHIIVIPTLRGLGAAILTGGIAWLVAYYNFKSEAKIKAHYDDDKAVDTGGFMTPEEYKAYADKYIFRDPKPIPGPVPFDPEHDKDMYSWNMPMSEHFSRPIRGVRIQGNSNVLVVGGSGSGKSRFFIKPNILQMNSSFVITDPSGEMIYAVGNVLKNHGYKIKIFNTSDMEHSNCYNPFHYIRDDAGVMMVVECLIKNTTGKGSKGDEFFTNAEKLLYTACIFYLRDFCDDRTKKNFATVMNMINASQVDENNANYQSPLDKLFAPLPHNSLAWKYYTAFKQAAGKTLKSIIISCVTRLQPFMLPSIIDLTSSDELELNKLGYEKTALFIITPQADRTFSFLSSLLYSQLFETLYHEGEELKKRTGDERLPVNVRCLMDEFANIGEVPEFPSKLATMRKYNISATVVIQDLTQLESMYKDEWHTLVSNCSSQVFLGTTETDTLKSMSEKLGKKTIRTRGESDSKNGKSTSFNITGRDVMSTFELSQLPPMECIVFTQSFRPVRDQKYEYTEHPYYNQTGDADPKNAFLYVKYKAFDVKSKTKYTSMIKATTEAGKLLEKANKTNIYLDEKELPKMSMEIFRKVSEPSEDMTEEKLDEYAGQYLRHACNNYQPISLNIGLSIVDYLPPVFFERTGKGLCEMFGCNIAVIMSKFPGTTKDYGMHGAVIASQPKYTSILLALFPKEKDIDVRVYNNKCGLYLITPKTDVKLIEDYVNEASEILIKYQETGKIIRREERKAYSENISKKIKDAKDKAKENKE